MAFLVHLDSIISKLAVIGASINGLFEIQMVSGPLILCCFLTASLAAVFVTNWALVAHVVSGFDVSLIKVLAMWPGTVLVNGKRISKKKTWMWSLIFWVKIHL
jgi:hypothetical protein